jgi:hypothetical protein
MRRRVIIHTLVILLILIVGASPLIAAFAAGAIADANGCTLHEGFVNPCIINGEDWGETLYTLFVLGWLAIGTIPIAVIAALVYLAAVVIIALVLHFRRRAKAAADAAQLESGDGSPSGAA